MAEETLEDRRLGWLLFFFLWVSFGYFYHTGQHNEEARFDQILALVGQHHWQIDGLAGNTADVIEFGGHVYPNKAPGTTYLGVHPMVALCAGIGGRAVEPGCPARGG